MKSDCTPEQYHHGLHILWEALHDPPMDGRTVYARIAERIAGLEAEVAILRDKLDQADIGNASLENEALCLMRWYDTARELLIRAHCQKIDSFLRADIKNHLEGKS